ncbi:hypothetical protein QBZ16_002429 [Prototheca wickerhamii]|uniref:OBG-type G domain-containing protein n=1 Tax=Prototheca wickerhamii TaxID=3111 RepID=A0AAD9IKK4_PROWI|nr:hypothetical protein QBZ16_002429 [Prototheca wickerhamii]
MRGLRTSTSTLFNALTSNSKAEAANFPFCTIEPNIGMRPVPTTMEFVDIAGLVKGASKGEGLGNKFLANIRECDSIVQVVRCFDNDDVIHVEGRIDPVEDIDTINFELALADLSQVEKRLERLKKGKAKTTEEGKRNEVEAAALAKIVEALEDGRAARTADLEAEEKEAVRGLCLLTLKPLIYAGNVAETDLADDGASNEHALKEHAKGEQSGVILVSAQVESELMDLDEAEAAEYLADLGAKERGLHSLIRATYQQLGLRTYFTTGEKESRAWTIRQGMTAPQGLVRLEGKDYVVQEGDIMVFRFNV